MAVNLYGVMVGIQRAARHMADNGGGSIVNITSIGGINAGAGLMTYRAAKAAVIHLSRSTAIDLAEHSIRVNCIAPAHVATAINTNYDQGQIVRLMQPLQRLAAAERRGGRGHVPRQRPRRADHRRRPAGRRWHHRRAAPDRHEEGHGRAPEGRELRMPGPATAVYSCDDHLDLSAVPPHVWESRLPRAQAERGPRVVERDGRAGVDVRGPGDRTQRHRRRDRRDQEAQRDRSRRDRGRRLPCRHARTPPPGPRPRRSRRVGDLRAARARVSRSTTPRCRRRATRHGTTGRSRSSTPSLLIACACSRSCPATPPRLRRRSSSELRGSGIAARSSTSSASTSATRHGIASGPPPSRRACPSASTSRVGRGPGSAIDSASGSRRPSPRSCRCSSTRRSPRWCSAARSNGIPAARSCWRSRASGGCRTSSPGWISSGKRSATRSRGRSTRHRASCSGAR